MNSSDKKLIAGVDEAGYGPNLGPLVVAASLWSVPSWMSEVDLQRALQASFACAAWHEQCSHVPLGDSKQLYRPGGGLQSLESGLAALLATATENKPPAGKSALPDWMSSLQSVLQQISVGASFASDLPWYCQLDQLPVPCFVESQEILRLHEIASRALDTSEIHLIALRASVITEREFNTSLDRLGSKGLVLTTTSLQLLDQLLAGQAGNIEVFCDRHGGRKDYLPCLVAQWPEKWFHELSRRPERSSYRESCSEPHSTEMTIHFSVGGDEFPPTALASMMAKYLRERLMEAFNQFWRGHLPGIRPTAGYPVDAKRFVCDLGKVPERLGLAPEVWWRMR